MMFTLCLQIFMDQRMGLAIQVLIFGFNPPQKEPFKVQHCVALIMGLLPSEKIKRTGLHFREAIEMETSAPPFICSLYQCTNALTSVGTIRDI